MQSCVCTLTCNVFRQSHIGHRVMTALWYLSFWRLLEHLASQHLHWKIDFLAKSSMALTQVPPPTFPLKKMSYGNFFDRMFKVGCGETKREILLIVEKTRTLGMPSCYICLYIYTHAILVLLMFKCCNFLYVWSDCIILSSHSIISDRVQKGTTITINNCKRSTMVH